MLQEILFTVRMLSVLSFAALIVVAAPVWLLAPVLAGLAQLVPTLVTARAGRRARPVPANEGGVDLTKR